MAFCESHTQALVTTGRDGQVTSLRAANGTDYPLDGHRWVIGKDPSCDVVLAGDPFVSSVHCVIERQPGGVLIVRDRGSRNGTHVNGSAVEGAELRVGSSLCIGRTILIAVGARTAEPGTALDQLRGSDPVLRATIADALRAAKTECNVLIVGETGTGKDLLARVVHEASRRATGKLVAVNCGAIPRELIAAELFGHERGAFTGASGERDGYFVEAQGGTLFLDELGELPIEMQPNLLRALESRRVRRVGGSTERAIDARIIAATNQLDGLGTSRSRLREDLYHRVATVVLELPPLRERMTDLAELVNARLDQLAPEFGRKQVTPAAWDALALHTWPGNVRELMQFVSRAVALGGDELSPRDFFRERPGTRPRIAATPPPPLASLASGAAEPSAGPFPATTLAMPAQDASINDVVRGLMASSLAQKGSIRAAAKHLGMAKSTFADKARQFGLRAPRGRRRG